MKTIITIAFLFCLIAAKGQITSDSKLTLTVPIAEFKTELGAKIVVKRFDLAVIYKEIYKGSDNHYYIELEEGDHNEYFQFMNIKLRGKYKYFKVYCLPRKLRKEFKKLGYIDPLNMIL